MTTPSTRPSATVVCTVLAACGAGGVGGASTATGGGPSTSTGSGAGVEGFPVTIQNCGRTLTFAAPPGRAVLGYHPIAEMFVGLGLADRAIGRVGYQGSFSTPPMLPELAADFARIPVVSGTNLPPPREKLVELRPDFLLAYSNGDYGVDHPASEGLATLDDLSNAGVQVYTVDCSGSNATATIDDTYRAILDLGRIFGVSDRAEQRVAQMKAQVASVENRVAAEPKVKVLAYFGSEGPLGVIGGTGIDNQIIGLAGGDNVFADEPSSFFQAPLEVVAAKDVAAFIVYPQLNEPTKKLDGSKESSFLFDTFPNLQASKDRRIALNAFDYTSPGWRNAQAVEDLARQLHPAAFP